MFVYVRISKSEEKCVCVWVRVYRWMCGWVSMYKSVFIYVHVRKSE